MAGRLCAGLGDELADPEEDAFLVLSHPAPPSQDLGIVNPKAEEVELTVDGRDTLVRQSPGLLTSNREGGTTGAVLWRVTPPFASWIASPQNILWKSEVLDRGSTVVELGTGVSGLLAVTLGAKVERYIATDQPYVLKVLRDNVARNLKPSPTSQGAKGKRGPLTTTAKGGLSSVEAVALDWQTDSVLSLRPYLGGDDPRVNVLVACDCIYNDSLVGPFVSACADICREFRPSEDMPTVCIVAQQLRSPDVFEAWLKEFWKVFRVWRVPDELLDEGLRLARGFVVHIGVLRDS